MHPPPLKGSIDLVRKLTGQDLSGLNREEFIAKVEELLAEQKDSETNPKANAEGKVKLTLNSLGDSWILEGVISAEKKLRLN